MTKQDELYIKSDAYKFYIQCDQQTVISDTFDMKHVQMRNIMNGDDVFSSKELIGINEDREKNDDVPSKLYGSAMSNR